MQKFLSELQRRKVLRVASGYVVVAWVMLQVALALQAAMKLPDWFSTVIVSLLIIGFPIAVVVSWFFEFTPDGIKRTVPSSEVARFKPQTADFALAAALVLVLAAVGVQMTRPQTPATPTAAAPKPEPEVPAASIAVLPFADLSPAKDQEYFSDGMAEEILNVLAHTNGLKVASRTSAFQYRRNTLALPQIAKALGVRHILEGSVRKAGDTVRITAQLIDAKNDAHLWSQTFDRPLTTATIFSVQEEIAQAIVQKMNAHVAQAVPTSVHVRTADTESVDAYDLYLRGWGLFLQRGKDNLAAAATALERATAIDPKFARAWAALSVTYAVSLNWGVKGRDYPSLALEAATTAQRLDANLALPLAAHAVVLSSRISTDAGATWEEVVSDYDLAVEKDAKNATAWLWRGINYVNLGYFDRAEKDFAQCAIADPGYENCRRWLAQLRLHQGRYAEAFQLFEAGLKAKGFFNRNPQFAAAYAAHGDARMALTLLALPFSDEPRLIEPIFRSLTDPTFNERDRTEALAVLNAVPGGATYAAEAHLLLRDYDNIPNTDIDAVVWWFRVDPAFLKSGARKKLMRAWRLPEYWRKHGFPPQCKAVGADDFECK